MSTRERGGETPDEITAAAAAGSSTMADGAVPPEHERQESPQEMIRRRLIEVLDLDNRVNFVLAMGSSAEGKEGRFSDIDICVVMRDDAELNEILGELPEFFAKLGKLVGYYSYNPYHFYAVYEPSTPLDIYFISPSLYFTVKSDKNKKIVDHSNRAAPASEGKAPAPAAEVILRKEKSETEIIKDLFLKL